MVLGHPACPKPLLVLLKVSLKLRVAVKIDEPSVRTPGIYEALRSLMVAGPPVTHEEQREQAITLYEVVVFGDVHLVAPRGDADAQPHPGILQAWMPTREFPENLQPVRRRKRY